MNSLPAYGLNLARVVLIALCAYKLAGTFLGSVTAERTLAEISRPPVSPGFPPMTHEQEMRHLQIANGALVGGRTNADVALVVFTAVALLPYAKTSGLSQPPHGRG